jgi:hypothetical protein
MKPRSTLAKLSAIAGLSGALALTSFGIAGAATARKPVEPRRAAAVATLKRTSPLRRAEAASVTRRPVEPRRAELAAVLKRPVLQQREVEVPSLLPRPIGPVLPGRPVLRRR